MEAARRARRVGRGAERHACSAPSGVSSVTQERSETRTVRTFTEVLSRWHDGLELNIQPLSPVWGTGGAPESSKLLFLAWSFW